MLQSLLYMQDAEHVNILTNTHVDVKQCIAFGPALPCPALPCPALPCPALPCPCESVKVSGTWGSILLASRRSDVATCFGNRNFSWLTWDSLLVCSQLGLLRRHQTMWDRQDPVVLCSFEVDRVQCEHLLVGQMPVSRPLSV